MPAGHGLAFAVSLAGWFLLADGFMHYHRFIATTGGKGHDTFRTAAVEPKQQAVEQIVGQADGKPMVVVAGEHWLYWPLRYFAATHENVTVVSSEAAAPAAPASLWRVEFSTTAAGVQTRRAPSDWSTRK